MSPREAGAPAGSGVLAHTRGAPGRWGPFPSSGCVYPGEERETTDLTAPRKVTAPAGWAHVISSVQERLFSEPCLGSEMPILSSRSAQGPLPTGTPPPSLLASQVTWFHMDCQDLMAQLKLGKAQKASPGDQRRLHRYLQRLSSEFPAEKLTAMGLQVASLSSWLVQGPLPRL